MSVLSDTLACSLHWLQVSFSPDCRRLLALTVDGKSFKLEAVPEDPTLIDTLTAHNVDIIVLARPKEVRAPSSARSACDEDRASEYLLPQAEADIRRTLLLHGSVHHVP